MRHNVLKKPPAPTPRAGWALPTNTPGGQCPPYKRRSAGGRRATGFTLIEVLAAIVLVGIVIPVAMEAISLSLRSASDAKRKVEAAMLAENKLSELTTNLVLMTRGATSGDFAPDWPDYRWESGLVQRDVDLSELQVRVVWTSRGVDRFVSLSTFVYTGVPTTDTSTGLGGSSTSGGPS